MGASSIIMIYGGGPFDVIHYECFLFSQQRSNRDIMCQRDVASYKSSIAVLGIATILLGMLLLYLEKYIVEID